MTRLPFLAAFFMSLIFSCAFAHDTAEDKKIFLVGVISFDTPFLECQRGLDDGLKQIGGMDKQIRYAIHDLKKDLNKIPAIVRKLQQQHCDLIVTTSTPVVIAVKKSLQQGDPIPVVFTMVADPVGLHIVPSLQNPGGNISGINYNAFAMMPKRLSLLREAFPDMKKIAVFYNHGEDWITSAVKKMLLPAAESLNFQVVHYDIRSQEDMIAAAHHFDNAIEGIFMVPDPLAISFFGELVSLSRKNKLPIMVLDNILLEKGGVLGYSPSFYSIGVQAASMVARVLSGVSPGRLSVQNPNQVQLIVSLKEAQRLDLILPESFLSSTDIILR